MTLIAIRERASGPDRTNATLSFDGGPEYPVTVRDPFAGTTEEERLEWYFEEHLQFPFVKDVEAREAAASVTRYGEALFGQVFADRQAFARYSRALQAGVGSLLFDVAGSPDFHHLHWEALKDPDLPRAFSLEAPMVRKNLIPQAIEALVQPAPVVRLLIVTARPYGGRDVGYRTISRPLVDALRRAELPVEVEILRPGTYRALVEHLEEVRDRHGAGHYHVVHFDTHGALLPYNVLQEVFKADRFLYQARYGRADIPFYDGLQAFLFLEGEKEDQADPVAAAEIADLLQPHQVPVAILNACQSGKQVGSSETSLGSRLMQAGLQMVLAMSYSVTVSAAERLMQTLYAQLFAGKDLATAVRRGRLELYNQKTRRAYFDQTIDLEDWILPVVYQNQPVRLNVRDFTPEERSAWHARQDASFREPETTYGFVGRDLDVLAIEKRLLKRNLLLVRGLGGAGKTTLLCHLRAWWNATGFVEQVFYFGFDERGWTREQILVEIGTRLLGELQFRATLQSLQPDAQQAEIARRLRAHRHLLILDNLESITGTHLAIPNTLPPKEREALRRLLADLTGGHTLVLLGSRGGEAWLAKGTFEDNVYDLPGLDPEAASALADRILERHGASHHRQDEKLEELLDLLAGYPLPLQVVLRNLAKQTPTEVLSALREGDVSMDAESPQEKTESILRCIDYSHGNLSPDAQKLLVCLAPFTKVVNRGCLPQYTKYLRRQPVLAGLPFDRWKEVLKEAEDWGLVSPHEVPGYLRLQPTFPYFLRSRLNALEHAEVRRAVETAFRQLFTEVASALNRLLKSKKARKQRLGQFLMELEYMNVLAVIDLALKERKSILEPFRVLSNYLDLTQDHLRGLELGERVLATLERETETLENSLSSELPGILDNIAMRLLGLKKYSAAVDAYQRALSLFLASRSFDEQTKQAICASVYHQLGRVAEEQRQWDQAEEYHQKALKIRINHGDRSQQAHTYHQLGIVAQEQRQWEKAREHYQKALTIYIDSGDRYSQARTYHHLGMVAQEERRWERAEKEYKKALKIFLDFNKRPEQAAIYHQLGVVAQEQRQWDLTENYFQKALEIRIKIDDQGSQAGCYYQLGIVAEERQQWEQAEAYYQRALKVHIESSDPYYQALTYHQLGNLAQRQRQWDQAKEYYQRALKIKSKIDFNDRYSLALTYHNLGRVAQEQRQWGLARECLLKALATFTDKDEHNGGIVWRSLTQFWQASGDTELPGAVATVLGESPEEIENRMRETLAHLQVGEPPSQPQRE